MLRDGVSFRLPSSLTHHLIHWRIPDRRLTPTFITVMHPSQRFYASGDRRNFRIDSSSRTPLLLPAVGQQQEHRQHHDERPAVGEDTCFNFHLLRYPSVKISDSKKLAVRCTNRNGKSLVYFNRDLRCGRKLILKVENVDPGPDFGMIFGVTTCEPGQVFEFPYHLIDFCKPDYDCCGRSVWMKLRQFDRVGSYVVIERVFDAFIRFTFDGRHNKDMYDPPEQGFGRRRAYPFLMLTGSVSSVRILPAVPADPPVAYGRPPAASMQFTALRLCPQDNTFPIDSWIPNRNVSVNGLVLKRGSITGANRNYIFSNKSFALSKTIQFHITEVDGLFPGTITFGVTTHAPGGVSLESLPINSAELLTNRFSRNWYLSQDIIECIRMKQCLSLRRNDSGVTLKTGYKELRYLFYVDPVLTVYPFFNFNGAVRSISLLSNSAASFNMTAIGNELQSRSTHTSSSSAEGKCVICFENRADHMANPCNHVAFCLSCSKQAMAQSDKKCPLCRKQIDRISKIFLS